MSLGKAKVKIADEIQRTLGGVVIARFDGHHVRDPCSWGVATGSRSNEDPHLE